MKSITIKFQKISENIYAFDPTREKVSFMTTLQENKKFFTKRQFERAKTAGDLLHNLCYCLLKDFKAAITMNHIKYCPITVKDIDNSEKIFGVDIPSMKGKVTRQKPIPVMEDIIEIPQELRMTQMNVTLCVDVMHVNSLTFLTTISRNLYYRSAQHIKTTSKDELLKALETLFSMYHNAGFRVKTINADNAFRPLMEEVSKYNIKMNFTSAQKHVLEAENNNRRIKERVRAVYYQFPYKHLCKALIIMMVMESAKKMNFFPAKMAYQNIIPRG